jgi:type II secretory pathway pseudopilin PulG
MTELMVCIVLVCIIAALALPGMGALSSRKVLTHQVDQMYALLHQMRERAVRHGIPWRMIFFTDRREWVCFGDANRNGRLDPGEQSSGPHVLSRGINFGSSAPRGPNDSAIPGDGISFVDNRVCFSAMGTCNSGTIYLNSQDKGLALRVLPASGTVVVYEYDRTWRVVR